MYKMYCAPKVHDHFRVGVGSLKSVFLIFYNKQ